MTDIYQVSNYTPCQIGLVKGEDGRDGIDGINGVDGKSGKDGKDGLRGLSGSDGKSNYQLALGAGFVGSVDDYLLSMKGDKGLKGDAGVDAAIDSITVSTGAAGTSASVVTGGTPIYRTFALTIPRGDKGDKGETGTSATITSVTTTTGSAGSAASVSMGGTPTARTFNLTIPRGDTGATGVLPNFYASTTTEAPNTYLGADGVYKRSDDPSNASTRKVGTAAGNLVERDVSFGIGNQGYVQTDTTAPKIKHKKLTGFLTGTTTSVAHGVTASKLLDISISMPTTVGDRLFQGSAVEVRATSTNIIIANTPASAYPIGTTPYVLLVTYEA